MIGLMTMIMMRKSGPWWHWIYYITGRSIFCCCTFEFRSNGVISVFLILFGGVLMAQGRVIGWIFCSLSMFRSGLSNSLLSRRCKYVDIFLGKVL